MVVQYRLSKRSSYGTGTPQQRPPLRDLLTKKLEPMEAGQSYPDLITAYCVKTQYERVDEFLHVTLFQCIPPR